MSAEITFLKECIEKMDMHHQLEVLKLLKNMPTAPINENQNGTFVNLTILLDKDIQVLKEYVEYVNDQQQTLIDIENKKISIQNKFFKDNKDNFINESNGGS